MGGVVDSLFGGGGDDAADASRDAANISAEYQREALDYLREREQLPQAYREAALEQQGREYGFTLDEEGNVISDGSTPLERAQQSPLYEAIMGTRDAGEEDILRNQAATGGFRSGNTQEKLYDYNTQLQRQALLDSYSQQMGGLQGLAGLPSLAPSIAGATQNIGNTLAQGEIAAAQAQQTGGQQGIGNIFGLANLGMQAYSTFSDIRLKDNVEFVEEINGFNWYRWDWNKEAEKLGYFGKGEGVMAHEIAEIMPYAVSEHAGYLVVHLEAA